MNGNTKKAKWDLLKAKGNISREKGFLKRVGNRVKFKINKGGFSAPFTFMRLIPFLVMIRSKNQYKYFRWHHKLKPVFNLEFVASLKNGCNKLSLPKKMKPA